MKPIIETKFSQLTDTKSLLAAVVEAEVAAADRRDRVHALEMEISALQKQAKTWQSGSSASGSGQSQRAGGASATTPKPQASGASSGPTHRQKVAARTKWINCFKCKQCGKHRVRVMSVMSVMSVYQLAPQLYLYIYIYIFFDFQG